MMYGSDDFYIILGHFLPFHPPNNLKIQNFKT